MPHLPSLPQNATLLDVFKRFPASSRPLLLHHEALMRGPSPFTEGERELIAAVVSRRNRCGYCEGVHAATARAMGETPARVASVLDDPAGARESAELRPVLIYVENVDAALQQAVEAGAEVEMPPADMFWGDRFAKLKDPFGHKWSLATHIEDVDVEEMGRRAAAFAAEMAGG